MRLMSLNLQLFAHKKAQTSTQNGRDSKGRRLGAKASDGQFRNGKRPYLICKNQRICQI